MTHYVAAHQDIVYTFCCRLLGQGQRAQDMAQKVFVKAWSPAHQGTTREETLRLLAIAYRTAGKSDRNGRLMPWIRNRRHQSLVGDGPATPAQELLSTLPTADRCLVILRYCCGLTAEEVSIVSGLPLDEVKSRICAARRELGRRSITEPDHIPAIGLNVATSTSYQTLS
jgi:DNA-directed RNA polymerase specialized sigma24 family protein